MQKHINRTITFDIEYLSINKANIIQKVQDFLEKRKIFQLLNGFKYLNNLWIRFLLDCLGLPFFLTQNYFYRFYIFPNSLLGSFDIFFFRKN